MAYQTLLSTDSAYPPLLRHLAQPPASLYVQGDLGVLERPCISIVGTRKPTAYAEAVLRGFIPDLVEAGFTIVSGLAYGVDSLAHELALEWNGSCCAVLGGGFDKMYPAAHRDLYEKMQQSGLVLTEYPPSMPPLPRHFPERNRIIAGLSLVTLVIEASERSGSLITAHVAMEIGRTVCVTPGDINRYESHGILQLINEGATAVRSVEDIVALYNLETDIIIPERLRPALTGTPARVLQSIQRGYQEQDEIGRHLNLGPQKVNAALGVLELDGYIVYNQNQWQKIL